MICRMTNKTIPHTPIGCKYQDKRNISGKELKTIFTTARALALYI